MLKSLIVLKFNTQKTKKAFCKNEIPSGSVRNLHGRTWYVNLWNYLLEIFLSFLIFFTAQHHDEHHSAAAALIARGEALLARIHKAFEEHHERSHLLGALEHESTLIEALVTDLKTKHNRPDNVWQLHHLHAIEEELFHHENRVAEELEILNNVHHHHKHEGHTVEELIRRAEALIHEAKQTVEHNRHLGHREVRSLEHEVKSVEELVHKLRQHPHGHDARQEEHQLARHEQSLRHLIERLNHHHHEHHHDDHHDDPHHEPHLVY